MNKEVEKKDVEGSKASKTLADQKNAQSHILSNIELTVEAFLGQAKLTVSELNALKVDSLVELDTALNAAIDLRLNGTSIAKGELVAVGDNFGVRITSIAQT
ncbi:FliM/FliN family flagellar motor switch protein [Fretibacter rubidus]|uniref:FliM/FliN family flagellar motor switch protein n=1 Tax=Fretibacter rubidus TaxID=570162 RepID=UPI00352B20F3